MNKLLQLLLCLALPLAVSALGAFATIAKVNSSWYENLNRPFYNPPNYLFGPVWSVLYLLMGVSLYLILQSPKNNKRSTAIVVFAIQLGLNLAWSFLFFYFEWIGAALIEIVFIWIGILTMIICFYPLNKTAALLQLPYLLWVSFATALNAGYWFLN